MSSLITSSSGLRRIEVYIDGKRYRIRLGRMSAKDAAAMQVRIDAMCLAKSVGRRDPDAEQWCERLAPTLRSRLAKAGLLHIRDDETLAGLIRRFRESRGHVKTSTAATDKQMVDSLLEYFNADGLIHHISPIPAEGWRLSLIEAGFAEATVAKRIKKARSMFAQAVRWGLIDRNPFADVRAGSQTNKARIRFIDDATSRLVLDACPNAEWRAIFALARWGGLRIPSELAGLRWDDVFFDQKKLRITSPKTAHHEGGGERWMVLLPQVEKALLDMYDLPDEAGLVHDYIFSAKRRSASNLRTNMTKIVRRAGLTPWPKLFHNLRASLETELALVHPLHAVCSWLGNSAKVAEAHYLSVPDSLFLEAAQNAAHQRATMAVNGKQNDAESPENPISDSESVSMFRPGRATQLRNSLRKLLEKHVGGAKSGAVADEVLELLAGQGVQG